MGRVVNETGGLVLSGDSGDRCDLSSAHPVVVAEAIDVDIEACGGRRDLEVDGVTLIGADVGSEALKRTVARSCDVPLGLQVAGLGVLAHDRVRPALRGNLRAAGVAEEE